MKNFDCKSRKQYLAQVKQLFDSEEDLSFYSLLEHHPDLLNIALKEFGGWENAAKAAGIEPEKYAVCRMSKERIIENLQNYYKNGADITRENMFIMLNPVLADCAVQQFGSYEAALEAAGIDIVEIEWTIDKIRKKLDELYAEGYSVTRQFLIKKHPEILRAMYRLRVTPSAELQAAAKRSAANSEMSGKQNKK